MIGILSLAGLTAAVRTLACPVLLWIFLSRSAVVVLTLSIKLVETAPLCRFDFFGDFVSA